MKKMKTGNPNYKMTQNIEMKYSIKNISMRIAAALLMLAVGLPSAYSQCDSFNENSFDDLCITQTGNGIIGPASTNAMDIWDLAAGAAGTDGTADIQYSLEAVVFNGGCAGENSTGVMAACLGSATATGSSDFSVDFNQLGMQNTCINTGGYLCVTIDFLNGFSSTAAGFNIEQSSNNGTSEGYEGSFGYVTAATDQNGTVLSLPTINLSSMTAYTHADYAAGTQMSSFIGVTGPGTFQTDDFTGTINDCATSTEGGEDTDSGIGSNNGDDATANGNANLGLNPTDIITQVKYIYFYSSTPSSDCNNDGLTAANSSPSSSLGIIEFCGPAAPYLCPNPGVIQPVDDICSNETLSLSSEGVADTEDAADGTVDFGVEFVHFGANNPAPANPYVGGTSLGNSGPLPATDPANLNLANAGGLGPGLYTICSILTPDPSITPTGAGDPTCQPFSCTTFNVENVPAAPVAENQFFCTAGDIMDVTPTGDTGASFNFYSDAGLTNLLSSGTSYTPTGINETIYITQFTNGCEGPAISIDITIGGGIEATGFTQCVNGATDAGMGEFFTQVTVTSGSAPFDISYTGGDGAESFMTTGLALNVADSQGVYVNDLSLTTNGIVSVTITDADGCTLSFELNETVCGFDPTGDDDDNVDPIEDAPLHHVGFICDCEQAPFNVAMLVQANPNSYTSGGSSGYSQVYLLTDSNGNFITGNYTGFFNGGMSLPTTGMTEGMYSIYAANGLDVDINNLLMGLTLGDNVPDAIAGLMGCIDASCVISYDINCGCCKPNAGVVSTPDCQSYCSNPNSSGYDVLDVCVDFGATDEPPSGYAYAFAVTDINGSVLMVQDPATQYNNILDPAPNFCEPIIVPALAPGDYLIYGINYNPNMMIFNGLPSVGDDIDMWSMGIQENNNTDTNMMTVTENGYALDCADITLDNPLPITVLEPLDFEANASCQDANGTAVVGEWYVLVESAEGGQSGYSVCDNKGSSPQAFTSQTVMGPYPIGASSITITIKDMNAAPCQTCVSSMEISAPTFPVANAPEISVCTVTPAYSSFDLTTIEGSIGSGDVAWFEGQPSNGGTPLANPTQTDLGSITDLWALLDLDGCLAEVQVPINKTTPNCGATGDPYWDGQGSGATGNDE